MLAKPIEVKPGVATLLIRLADQSVNEFGYMCKDGYIYILFNDQNHIRDNDIYLNPFECNLIYSTPELIAARYRAYSYNVILSTRNGEVLINVVDPDFCTKVLEHLDNFDPKQDGMR